MGNTTDYEELYRMMQSRRRDEFRQIQLVATSVSRLLELLEISGNSDNNLADRLRRLASYVAGLVHTVKCTDRIVAECAGVQSRPEPEKKTGE